MHLDRDRQATDAFLDLLRWRIGEVQAHVASAFVAVVGVKAAAGYKRDILRQRRNEPTPAEKTSLAFSAGWQLGSEV